MTDAERSRNYRRRHPQRHKASTKRWRENNREAHRKMCRNWVEKNYDPKRQAVNYRKYRYGITQPEFDAKKRVQKNRCAICKVSFRSLKPCIDHDHKTKANRELLCRYCNLILGNARDKVNVLLSAVRYLRKHGVRK